MEKFQTSDIPKSPRIQKLVDALYEHMPVIESARAKLITESYKEQKENRSSHAEQRLLRIFFITFRSLSVTMN